MSNLEGSPKYRQFLRHHERFVRIAGVASLLFLLGYALFSPMVTPRERNGTFMMCALGAIGLWRGFQRLRREHSSL